eukprot:TRINITY_DN2850_c0_g1_i1.p2 TRINITY_DN2850_c0_g1~~TRINITY_DN2850_c0_g1_i1.p2  ORF type:complete len:144 (-),score=7.22 TRINITY_DN2850_c0_g1_i1:363-794(-)
MFIAGSFQMCVKCFCIVLDYIMRRKIDAAAKPAGAVAELKIAHVHMNDGYFGTLRMHHNGNARCRKVKVIVFAKVHLCPQTRMHFTGYSGKINTSFFNHAAVLDQSRPPTTAGMVLPKIFFELGCTVLGLNVHTNTILQSFEK